jgi:hypothetical protein
MAGMEGWKSALIKQQMSEWRVTEKTRTETEQTD